MFQTSRSYSGQPDVSPRLKPLMFNLCVGTLAMAAAIHAPGAEARPMYRYVQPDGTVVLTDRPPLPSQPQESREARQLRTKAARGKADEQVLDAAVKVMVTETMIKTMVDFCERMVPQTYKTVSAARNRWYKRHAKLAVSKGIVFKSLLAPERQHELEAQARKDALDSMDILDKLSPPEREARCNAMPELFASPDYDLVAHPEIGPLVTGFRPRK